MTNLDFVWYSYHHILWTTGELTIAHGDADIVAAF